MCAIVGIYGNENAARLASVALFAMQHRGQEATGISSSCNGKIYTKKDRGLVTEVFTDEALKYLKGNMAIGHNRYSTAGGDSILDAQPVYAKYKLGEISIVHNGNLINKDEVRQDLIDKGAIFQTGMDTENLIHLIAKNTKDRLRDRIKEALNRTIGAYCFIVQSRSKQFVIRDRYGIRPLSIGKLKSGGYIVASETCAFDLVGAEFIRDVRPGEMLILAEGCEPESIQLFEPEYRPCAFEFVYFARPDSVIDGKNVYVTRENMGKALALNDKDKNIKVDMVIPVPDSGVPAALGYAAQSGIPFEYGIIRNHYIGRTFIEPTQEMRDLKVRMKLSPMKSLIEGKSLLVIDDSIVRGTTSKRIVKILKEAGAKEVHFRVASPEIKFPCYYGIDTPHKEELISNNMNKEEVCKYIEADSLEYLSVDDLVNAIGNDRNYALESFNGDYFVKA
ncbi:MAG: amidophosphoribosyltransferase [Arcobacter sp.]|jgi:amidophosphoribosyltransferase|uniref:Amidophosphoribosyltransferase n=1 Tax=Arcobacter defluvii TaxID=873191 RepID=A0AAE7E881_9BACT|nr:MULTISPECIES: amidophosphoribosyltransferase [Arcobacter]MDY3199485.1 amidophosphoribosyltransferase [Arcobacter sp.]QKF78683.1 amidophosphoribosyltransferase [Arcobacter defluvii]RXI34003.1 amidophosphoribosyltransferase [Arcobacter defluvii]BAK74459.1 amidophosphoribosyltransferase [Arcobacter sp. L]